jgi:hypothetical protein
VSRPGKPRGQGRARLRPRRKTRGFPGDFMAGRPACPLPIGSAGTPRPTACDPFLPLPFPRSAASFGPHSPAIGWQISHRHSGLANKTSDKSFVFHVPPPTKSEFRFEKNTLAE